MSSSVNQWAQNLLDLSPKNPLLNTKIQSKSVVNLETQDLQILFDRLQNNQVMTISTDEESFSSNSIMVEKKESLSSILNSIRNKSNLSLEDTGSNILFLTFGYAKWMDDTTSDTELLTPIILMPIELKKISNKSGFAINKSSDEVIVNPVLKYILSKNYQVIIDDFDEEESSLSFYYSSLKSKTSHFGWQIIEQSSIGLLNFSKHEMYLDLLKNKESIEKHPIIQNLMGVSTGLKRIPDTFLNSSDIDSMNSVFGNFQVINSDSSQQVAILAAKKGYSFVLQGPPGTGKSQTITNIIGEFLADGKKVLFVAEKMSALNVVYQNLKKQGLSQYVLEMHSHKSNKAKIVKELTSFLEVPRYEESFLTKIELNRYLGLRNTLNQLSKELHKPIEPFNWTFFEVNSQLTSLNDFPNLASFIPNFENLNNDTYQELINAIELYAQSYSYIEDTNKLLFNGFNHEISYDFIQGFIKEVNLFTDRFHEYIELRDRVSLIFSDDKIKSFEFDRILMFLKHFSFRPLINSKWIDQSQKTKVLQILKVLKKVYPRQHYLNKKLASIFNATIDYEELYQMLNDYREKYRLSPTSNVTKAARKRIKKVILNESLFGTNSFELVLKNLSEYITYDRKLKIIEPKLTKWIGPQFKTSQSNFDEIIEGIAWLIEGELFNTNKISLSWLDMNSNEIMKFYNEINNLKERLELSNEFFNSCFTVDSNWYYLSLYERIEKLNAIIDDIDQLELWMGYVENREKLKKYKIFDLINEIEKNNFEANSIVQIVRKRALNQWVDTYKSNFLLAYNMQGEDIEGMRKKFIDSDLEQFKVAQNRIQTILSQRLPKNVDSTIRHTELSILEREAQKTRKLLPVRQLFDRIPNHLLNIKPCFLMSPLSVSTYINPDSIHFDVVIFDEASQVKTENAVGAIYRGQQLIVVGDPEQLPPTDFFSINQNDNDDISFEDSNVFESVLDEASSVLQKIRLKWHYRSKDERLIAFSNQYIYGDLVTFPNSQRNVRDFGLEMIYVKDGVYDRGQKRDNPNEAKIVAELVLKHAETNPSRTLGVVTFNESQRELIEDLVFKLRSENSHLDSFFNSTKDEPFFVKNLENVQGDERDSIILSVGYAKDQNNVMSLNFGPLSKEGGYRRLNVAITRAKLNIKLVSSILPTDLNLNENTSKGVKMLKDYLEYASIRNDLNSSLESIKVDKVSILELQVKAFLEDNGFKVDLKVGLSNFRVNLAIKNPDSPNEYVVGILCDSNEYKDARTSRDRERLQQEVLELRGWKIIRIYSNDWAKRRVKAEQKLLNKIKELSVNVLDDFDQKPTEIEEIYKRELMRTDGIDYGFIQYQNFDIFSIHKDRDETNEEYIKRTFESIIEIEYPIHINDFLSKILPLYGRNSSSASFKESIIQTIRKVSDRIVLSDDFLYLRNQEVKTLRVSKKVRKISQISPVEIEVGFLNIIKYHKGIQINSLVKELLKSLNLTYSSNKNATNVLKALDILKINSNLKFTEEFVSYTEIKT